MVFAFRLPPYGGGRGERPPVLYAIKISEDDSGLETTVVSPAESDSAAFGATIPVESTLLSPQAQSVRAAHQTMFDNFNVFIYHPIFSIKVAPAQS